MIPARLKKASNFSTFFLSCFIPKKKEDTKIPNSNVVMLCIPASICSSMYVPTPLDMDFFCKSVIIIIKGQMRFFNKNRDTICTVYIPFTVKMEKQSSGVL